MGTVQLRKGLLNRREKVFGRLVGPAYPPLQITHPGPNTQELRKSLRGCGGVSYTNWGGFPIQYVSWCILHVSCMYSEGYMYPECILMYLKCILHALLHSKRIHVSWHFANILHVFYTYPKRVQDTFWDTHQIHQDTCILGASLVSHWIHVRIHQDTCISWTLHQDTSGYTEIQNHDTCILDGIHAGYNLKRIPRIYPVRYVTEMQDTCEIHSRYIRDTCICRGDQDTCGIHLKYIMRYMYLKCIQRSTYLIWRRHAGYVQDTCSIHVS